MSQVKSFHAEPILYNGLNDRSTSLETLERNPDVTKSDFQKLENKVFLLERKLRKKLKKQEVNRIPTCCSYQHPNNCYFGPYPGFFQPGPVMKNEAEFMEFQRWQESLRNRKRILKAANQGERSRGRRKLRKKRKPEGGTSGWKVDSFPDKDLANSDRVNTWGSDSETVEDSLRAESPLAQFEEPISRPSKRRKLSESCSLPRIKKQREKLVDLFSPAQSPVSRTKDPESNAFMDKETSNETPKLNCSLSDTFSEEEAVENCTETPKPSFEYEEVERTSKKRKKGDTKPLKKSTKSSLVSKIRNLKNNCNKSKAFINSASPANDSTLSKLIRNKMNGEISVANKPKNNPSSIPLTKVDQTANIVGDYCLVKKQRIAHSARKTKNESVYENVDKNVEQVSNILDKDKEKVNFIEEDSRVNNDRSQPAAKIEKVNDCVEKNEKVECKEDSNPVIQFKRSSSLKNIIDSNNSRLANNKALKNVDVEPVVNTVDHISSPSISEASKILDAPLQPCVMIPKQFLRIEGVTDPLQTVQNTENNETAEHHSLGNLNSSIENDASLRILRSHSKVNDSIISSELPNSPMSEMSESRMEVSEALVSVKSDQCQESTAEIFENEKVESAIVESVKYKRKAKVKALSVSPMRELRSRRIMLSPSNTINKIAFVKEKIEEETTPIGDHESEKVIERLSFGPRALIEEHFIEIINSKKKNTTKLKSAVEKLQQRRGKSTS